MNTQVFELDDLLDRHQRVPHRLVQILREIQAARGWLSRPDLSHVATALKLPLAHVEGVAGFYHFFHLEPVGEYRVLFSDNITDRMGGSEELQRHLRHLLKLAPGGVRADCVVVAGPAMPPAIKWQLCRNAVGSTRVVVCNADEGEPGTFKDRVLLNRLCRPVFEGMTMAAHCGRRQQGLLYLRGEYRYLLESLQASLARRAHIGLLGAVDPGPGRLSISTSPSMSAPAPMSAARSRR
jgi:hypothetical protein